ncbi:MAG: 3-oxoacyl-ACP reductase FabG [Alistipes sp.]|nr:3-oxoacyl-ACP reductase FabG [Alistipes sp.]
MKYALVTGGSRGIGRAVCRQLASMGYCVVINYVSNDSEAQATLAGIETEGGCAELLKFDVSDRGEASQAIARWHNEHPGEYISALVNNAGVRKDNLMMWMPGEEWDKVLNISLGGFFNVTQPLLKNMLSKKNGRIVNIVSLSGISGMAGQTNYSAAKGAVIAATKALAKECARKKVTVNAIAPGFIATEMTGDLDQQELRKHIPAGRFGTPEEVAALAGFLVSDPAGYITGEVISINGGIYT